MPNLNNLKIKKLILICEDDNGDKYVWSTHSVRKAIVTWDGWNDQCVEIEAGLTGTSDMIRIPSIPHLDNCVTEEEYLELLAKDD